MKSKRFSATNKTHKLLKCFLIFALMISSTLPSVVTMTIHATEEIATTIPHTKRDGTTNKFTFSSVGWSNAGNQNHVWSDVPPADNPSAVWYQVDFVGHKIDIYSGKNHPMGKVEYFIDNESMGVFSLYNSSNIDSTYITTFDGLSEGPHVFKAVAKGEIDTSSTNTLIDCAKVIVYHEPYVATDLTLPQDSITISEGATHNITYTLTPDYAEITDMNFTSSNNAVASVNSNGVITALAPGEATITLSSASSNITKTLNVTVQESIPSLGGSIVDTNTQYTQARYEEVKAMSNLSTTLTAWKNDKAVSEIALVSKDSALNNVSITVDDLRSEDGVIAKENVEATFIKSTKAYNGAYLGYGSTTREIPADNGSNRSESNDILYQSSPINIGFNKVQPVWLAFNIPSDAKAGVYQTTVRVSADDIDTPLTFTYQITVQDATLPDATSFKDSFDVELWQYPYSSAEYYDVEPFSQEHLDLMRSSMEIYKSIGGHAITASISEEAWNGQTYSANAVHYPSMVKWIKNSDGSFSYDYTDFDKWVSFNKELGIGDKIVLYSIAPWHNSFTYWENNQLKYESFTPGSARYNEVWRNFLQNMIEHLMAKGWFDETYIGIDERGFNKAAFDLIDSVKNIHGYSLKTAGAVDNFITKADLTMRITDLNVGDTAAANHQSEFSDLVKRREAAGLRTTLYSCTEHQPGQFSLSNPVESYWTIINAGKETAGFLRWAYDAWVVDPLNDATHNSFEPGDCFLIYPDEKNATNPTSKSSVRLEKIAEGVRDINKIRLMVNEFPALQSKVDAMYNKLTFVPTTSHNYMSQANKTALINQMTTFKTDLNNLTEEYLELRTSSTDVVESVTINGGNQNITLGNTLQLNATVLPNNVTNNLVTWTSSDTSVASVNEDGLVEAKKIGTTTITAASVLDPSKKASITVTVSIQTIEEEARVAYYSFDNDTVNDSWGNRHGVNNGVSFVEGKSGKAIQANETQNVTFNSDLSIQESDDWTLSYWVKPTTAISDRFSVVMDKTKHYSFDLKMASNRTAGYHVGTGSGDVLSFVYTFEKDNWYNIAWTQSKATGLSMYVNGVLINTNAWTKTNTATIPFDMIGGTGFNGLVDEVKLYNRVLNASEINTDMLTKGLNISLTSATVLVGNTVTINTMVVSDKADKTVTFTSSNPEIASVDENGVVTGLKRGSATIVVENKAANYREEVVISVNKLINIKNVLPRYKLASKYLSDVEKAPGTDRQYLGQPDMVRTKSGRLIAAYPKGHGKGPIIMQISDDNGETWTEKTNIPASWAGSQETPTLYVLNLEDGTERIMMITACPGWGSDSAGYQTGWNTSYSDDNGETWSEYKHFYTNHADGSANNCIVGMASLIQLKDEDGNFIQKWMGVYHNYGYVNYKTYLTFDENGNEQWSQPEPYLSEYRSIESTYQICEVGLFRSPDGDRIVGLARSQSHNNPSTMFYSDDEGKTWSQPVDLPGSLAGERHKVLYDPISGRLIIPFREIQYDLNNNGQFDGGSDWTCGEWSAWVGTYEQLMNQDDGEYYLEICADYANNAKSGDTGYTGLVGLEDGTIIMITYGHWDQDFSLSWSGGVTTDLCYIKQAKFTLGEIENDNNLIDRSKLNEYINQVKNTDGANYDEDSFAAFTTALNNATTINNDHVSQQIQVNNALKALKEAYEGLEDKPVVPSVDKKALVDKIAEARATSTEGKTEESVAALNTAITAAEAVNNDANATQDEVNAQVSALDNAIKGLIDKPVVPSVDKKALVDKINEAKATSTEGKTEESAKALADAIKDGETVNANANATQAEVNDAVKTLDEAIKGLVDKPVVTPVDKTNLDNAIKRASIYVEERLSAKDKVVYSAALTAAKALQAKGDATQSEVDAATAALREAIKDVDSNMSFPDVKKGAWYYGVVDEAFARGLMGPTDNKKNTFSPDWNISRGMVATVLYRMAGAPNTTYTAKFPDVKKGEWYSNAIIWANKAGIINGYGDGNFGPDNNITREQLAIMLRNYAMNIGKLDVNADVDLSQFKDEEAISSYAVSAVKWAVANHIISGKGGTNIAPTDNATRGECAKMFMMLQDLVVK